MSGFSTSEPWSDVSNSPSLDRILSVAVDAAGLGGQIAERSFNKLVDTQIEAKAGSINLVTEIDREVETAITDHIHSEFSDHEFLGEESGGVDPSSVENSWLIDPIDGTTNYIHGMPHYAVSVAYAHRGEIQVAACLDVSRREMFTAVLGSGAWLDSRPIRASQTASLKSALIMTGFYYERGEIMEKTLQSIRSLFAAGIRGIRRSGSAALDICWVASGRVDGFYEYTLSPWDFAAAGLIAREAGAHTFDPYGQALTLDSRGVIVVASQLARPFLEVVSMSPA